MRSLRITLRPEVPATLPLAYNELVQGLVYSCWKDRLPNVHDYADAAGSPVRPFVFGKLEGRAQVRAKERTIRFIDLVSFELRSPEEELLDECAMQLANRGAARIGSCQFAVVNLQSNDRLLFPERTVIKTLSPIVAYRTQDDGHTVPYAPHESDWLMLVQQNAQRKAEAFGVPFNTPLQAIPFQETMRKRVTRFKGTYVTGWEGKFMISCAPEVLALLWCCGVGAKNSQGFGLFDIVDG